MNCLDTYDKNEDVWMDVLGVSVGDVTESDIQMASEFDGLGEYIVGYTNIKEVTLVCQAMRFIFSVHLQCQSFG